MSSDPELSCISPGEYSLTVNGVQTTLVQLPYHQISLLKYGPLKGSEQSGIDQHFVISSASLGQKFSQGYSTCNGALGFGEQFSLLVHQGMPAANTRNPKNAFRNSLDSFAKYLKAKIKMLSKVSQDNKYGVLVFPGITEISPVFRYFLASVIYRETGINLVQEEE